MPASWELINQVNVQVAILHTDSTTIAWSFGLRNLIIPGNLPILPLAGMPFQMARNVACKHALEIGASHLFFLDSDVVPPHDTIPRLLRHNKPIISGVYYRRSPPAGIPVMQKPVGQWLTRYPQNAVIEVDVVGAGCLLIHRSVLEKMPPQRPGEHWFDWRVNLAGMHPLPLSEDYTFCFTKGTWVIGEKVKKIEEVKIGDIVIDHLGYSSKVLDTGRRVYSGEMVQITANYVKTIQCTPSHRFWVLSKQAEWKEAKDISKGDWLFVPKINCTIPPIRAFELSEYLSIEDLAVFPDGKFGYKRTRKSALRLIPQVEVTPDFCRLLGYYLAEGLCPKKNNSLQFCFGSVETEYVEDCQKLLDRCFEAKSSIYSGSGVSRVACSSTILSKLFTSLCGNGAYEKHLPDFWAELDEECLGELIKGYWRGDGSLSRQMFMMSTVSEQLARDLQAAFLRLGFLSSLHRRDTKIGTHFHLQLPITQSERFSKLVAYDCGEVKPRKQERYVIEIDGGFWVKVLKSETYVSEEEVYNLKISGRESYTANGVGVHNCMHAKMAMGIPTMVDTSIKCRHIGYSESREGTFQPLEAIPIT